MMFPLLSYLTLKAVLVLIVEWDKAYGDNIINLHCALYPYFFHPFLKIFQMAIVIITVILSIDRYVVVFYPYRIYRHWRLSFNANFSLYEPVIIVYMDASGLSSVVQRWNMSGFTSLLSSV